MSATNIPNSTVTPTITTMAVRLARANELNLKKILAKGEEVVDKDILDALVDPLSRSNLFICKDKGCFVKVNNQNRVDKALETFTPVSENILITSKPAASKISNSKTAKSRAKKYTVNSLYQGISTMPEKWRSYIIDFSLVMAFLLIVLYGFASA